MANSLDPDQTAPIGAVCSGSTLFAPILNLSVMLRNYLQQTTSADDIFRCILSLTVFNFVTLYLLSGVVFEKMASFRTLCLVFLISTIGECLFYSYVYSVHMFHPLGNEVIKNVMLNSTEHEISTAHQN